MPRDPDQAKPHVLCLRLTEKQHATLARWAKEAGKAPLDVLRAGLDDMAAQQAEADAAEEAGRAAKIEAIKVQLAEAHGFPDVAAARAAGVDVFAPPEANAATFPSLLPNAEPDGFVRIPKLVLDGHQDEGPRSMHDAARRDRLEREVALEDAQLAALEGPGGPGEAAVASGEPTVESVLVDGEEKALQALFSPG